MESDNFSLKMDILDGKRIINFANNSSKFVEVIFTIDSTECLNGQPFKDFRIKGYGYPPKLQKTVKHLMNGNPLPFSDNGIIRAYIFEGDGKYRDDDIDKPALFRKVLVSRIKFKRNGDTPMETLEIKY
jgi:hypothetical protein